MSDEGNLLGWWIIHLESVTQKTRWWGRGRGWILATLSTPPSILLSWYGMHSHMVAWLTYMSSPRPGSHQDHLPEPIMKLSGKQFCSDRCWGAAAGHCPLPHCTCCKGITLCKQDGVSAWLANKQSKHLTHKKNCRPSLRKSWGMRTPPYWSN